MEAGSRAGRAGLRGKRGGAKGSQPVAPQLQAGVPLPSPHDLRGRILVKNKKRRPRPPRPPSSVRRRPPEPPLGEPDTPSPGR